MTIEIPWTVQLWETTAMSRSIIPDYVRANIRNFPPPPLAIWYSAYEENPGWHTLASITNVSLYPRLIQAAQAMGKEIPPEVLHIWQEWAAFERLRTTVTAAVRKAMEEAYQTGQRDRLLLVQKAVEAIDNIPLI